MKTKQVTSLHFAVRSNVVAKFAGQLLLIFSFLTAVPLLFSVAVGEYQLAGPYGAIIAAAGLAGYLLQRLKASTDIQNNESLVISALIFIIAPLIAAVPFHQVGLSWGDAIFEAVSGVTTTGLSCLPAVETFPRTFIFARAWLQWIGGLGIVVLSVAILLPQSKATLHLFAENWEKEGIVASTKSYARIILHVYLLLTLAGILLLLLLGGEWFDSLIHVLAAISTGGFSSFDRSLAGLTAWPARAAVTLISFLGAVPFIFYYILMGRRWREFTRNEEIRGLLLMALIATAATVTALVAADGFSLRRGLSEGTLLALSAQTTTGFSTVPVAELSAVAKFTLIPFMLIGGNVGSTAGGIKILRFLLLLKMISHHVVRSGLPANAVVHPRFMGRRLEHFERERCFLLILLFLLVIAASWFVFIVMGYPVLDSLFEVVSATCTVGLSTGITASSLPVPLKGILCLDMLMGRLEIVAFLVLVYPATWFGKKRGV